MGTIVLRNKRWSLQQIYNSIIFSAPFILWIGQYMNIGSFSLANYYVVLLTILNINFFRDSNNKYVIGYISFFVIMALYAALSLFFSINQYTVSIILSLCTGISTMIFIGSFNEKKLCLFLRALKSFTILILIWSILEIFTGKYLLLKNPEFTGQLNYLGLHYPATCFPNPNDLAQFLIMSSGVIIYADFLSKASKRTPLIMTLMELAVIVNTSSRLSFMCIFIFVIICYFLCLEKYSYLKNWLYLILPIGIGCIIIGLLINYDSVLDLISRFLMIDFSQSYVTLRSEIYKSLISLGEKQIFCGAGIGESYIASVVGPHNLFLFIFSDFGIFFSLGFVGVLLSLFFTLIKYRNFDICKYGLNQIMIGLLIVFPFFSSISSANEQRKTVWVFLGICIAVAKINKVKNRQLAHKLERG